MIECLLNISIIRHVVGNMHEARQNIVNAFALAQEIGDPFGIAACAVNQAELELDLANYDLADKLNERAGKIYTDLGHSLGLTYYYQNQAQHRMIAGELDPALAAATRARKLAEEKQLRKRVTELMRQEASIYYFQGDFSGTFGALNEAVKLCTEIHDEAGAIEAELKLGYVCLALLDTEGAKEHWRIGIAYKTKTPASEHLFWKAAAEGFIAVLDAQELKTIQKQEEMRSIAKKMEHAYLITASHLLSSMQLHYLGRVSEALIESQEAEKTATQFRQGLWLTRSRIYILEQRRLQSLPVSGNEVMLVMEAAKRQKQNEIIHRCYKMLFDVGWSHDKFRREWLQHWSAWQLHVPEPFRPRFEPL
jgi:tetratricopeptide (TPR) repeat protein